MVGEMKNNNDFRSRFAKGALSGFFVLPLLASTHFHPTIGKNTVKVSWSRVNGYLSHGVSKVSAKHERTKEAG